MLKIWQRCHRALWRVELLSLVCCIVRIINQHSGSESVTPWIFSVYWERVLGKPLAHMPTTPQETARWLTMQLHGITTCVRLHWSGVQLCTEKFPSADSGQWTDCNGMHAGGYCRGKRISSSSWQPPQDRGSAKSELNLCCQLWNQISPWSTCTDQKCALLQVAPGSGSGSPGSCTCSRLSANLEPIWPPAQTIGNQSHPILPSLTIWPLIVTVWFYLIFIWSYGAKCRRSLEYPFRSRFIDSC